jgi:tetratricopeptide (TPR) repeat protein
MRALPGLAAFLIAGCALAASQDTLERAMRQAMAESQRGMSALDKGNAAKAREAFDRALKSVPDFPEAVLGLGHVAMKEKRFDEALARFREAESEYKNMSTATVQFEHERYARSRDELQRLQSELTQLDMEAMQAQTRLSGSSSNVGQIERMRSQYRARIQVLENMNPPSSSGVREAPAEVFFYQGNALFNLKRTPEAIAAWEESLRRNPKQPLAENNLAVAYWMTGRLDDARAAVERAEALGFKVNPNFRADLDKAVAAKR